MLQYLDRGSACRAQRPARGSAAGEPAAGEPAAGGPAAGTGETASTATTAWSGTRQQFEFRRVGIAAIGRTQRHEFVVELRIDPHAGGAQAPDQTA